MWKSLFDSSVIAIHYDSLKLWSITKKIFTIQATADPCNVLNCE